MLQQINIVKDFYEATYASQLVAIRAFNCS